MKHTPYGNANANSLSHSSVEMTEEDVEVSLKVF